MVLNFDKLKAAAHYICEKAAARDPELLDPIKLNKVLWYSDSLAYLARGTSITGTSYMKKSRGPVPKHILIALDELEQDGAIMRGKSAQGGFWPTRFDLMSDANKTLFDGQELDIIDRVFKYVCLETDSDAISERTHGEVWGLAAEEEELPHYTVFAEALGEIRPEHIRAATADLTK